MLGWFKARAKTRTSAKRLYGASVAQSRREVFYAQWDVPDTMEGRYEVIVVHLFLLHNRLQHEGAVGLALSRAVLEAFMTDLDDNMREDGVSDTKVPRRIKKAAAGVYDRFQAYGMAMEAKRDAALVDVLQENFAGYERAEENSGVGLPDVAAIAGYMRAVAQRIHSLDADRLLAGKVEFLDLDRIDEEGGSNATK